jgi:hypothetical protein
MEHTGAERRVYRSRKTSFPIFSHDVGDSWLQLLNLVLRIGAEKSVEGGGRVAEALNAMVTVGLPVIAEDLEVEAAKPEAFPSFLEFNREDFERHFEVWRGIDHVEMVCDRLKGRLAEQSVPAVQLSPNTLSASFDVVDGTLFGSFVIRSIDVFSDWPLEAMALSRLHGEVADRLGFELGAATFVIHCVRLHESDWARTEQVLAENFRRPLPLQVDHSGVFLFGNDGGQARAMLLDHDAATIYWEDAFDTPEQLSWYIVDTMPWLLPQHIRYVGQECATLMRAMQESECYLQG